MADIWHAQKSMPGSFVLIPTNLEIDSYGHAIMGAGLAKQAADKYPGLTKHYAEFMGVHNTVVGREGLAYFIPGKLICFPTKYRWRAMSNRDLIGDSARQLLKFQRDRHEVIFCPKVGCGLGGLNWRDVKPMLQHIWEPLGDNLRFVE